MIAKLTRVNGVLKVDIDGQIIEPLAFKSFRPSKENISDFAKVGVRLFSILTTGRNCAYDIPYSPFGESWLGKGQYDLTVIDKQIDLFIENAPNGYFALMIQLDTRDWWLQSHENYPDSYGYTAQMAYDSEWREAAADYLQTVVRHVEQKYGERFYGYFLLCGRGTEWLSMFDWQASHPIKERYYRDYTNDPHAVIPSKEQLELSADISFYDDDEIKRYHRAHAELIADTILYFAGKVQEIIQHKKLVGLYFGYLFELGGPGVWNNGHLAYEKVFSSKDINIVSSPAAYGYRATDSVSAFMLVYKTLDIHDKLYYFEFDQRTYLSQNVVDGHDIPPAGYRCKDDLETVNLMRRDFILCAANGAALWWFDMWNGWYSSPEMLQGVGGMIEIAKCITQKEQHSIAEISVVASGDTLYKVNKMAHLNTKLLSDQREGLARIGAPYDVYSCNDLEKTDISQYKLFIFLSAFETTPEQDAVIDRIKNAGKSILWAYAPKYVNGGLDAVMQMVDMELGELSEAPVYSGEDGEVLSAPYFYVKDEKAKALAYFDDQSIAAAYKDCGYYRSFYTGIGNLSGAFLRKIAKLCGIHIYCETAPVYINSLLLGVYAQEDAYVQVKTDGVYEDLFTGKQYRSEKGTLFLPKDAYTSKLLLRME